MSIVPRFYRRHVKVEIAAIGGGIPITAPVGVSISNFDGDGLRIAFEVARTNQPEPDTAAISIWGLSETSIAKVKSAFSLNDTLPVRLFAGYENLLELIFVGQIYKLKDGREGFTSKLEMMSGDGIDGFRDGRLNESFGAETPLDVARKFAETAMGMQPGVDAEATFLAAVQGADVQRFSNGFVAHGKASDTLTEICAAVGVKWWIKDNKIVYVPKTRVTNDLAVSLSPNTGLLDHSEPREFDDIEFMGLLNPKIFPGRQIIVKDRFEKPVKGTPHRVDSCRYWGDMEGSEWYVEGVGRVATLT